MSSSKLQLAVLISGSGRTLKNFIDLAGEPASTGGGLPIEIRLVISSSTKAGGLTFAKDAGIPVKVIRRSDFRFADTACTAIMFTRPCSTPG
jgi:phosphoribosylglycinamide formyltransferase 1